MNIDNQFIHEHTALVNCCRMSKWSCRKGSRHGKMRKDCKKTQKKCMAVGKFMQKYVNK